MAIAGSSCSTCTTALQAGARFCHHCGHATEGAAGLFAWADSASSDEEGRRRAWEILQPHLDAARHYTSQNIVSDREWFGHAITKGAKGPKPDVRFHTQFFAIVYEFVIARETYRDVPMQDLVELSRGCVVSMSFMDRMPHDIAAWNVVVDPDGDRIQPEAVLGCDLNEIGRSYLHQMSWQFDATAVNHAAKPLTIALLRLPIFPEIRYSFSRTMR